MKKAMMVIMVMMIITIQGCKVKNINQEKTQEVEKAPSLSLADVSGNKIKLTDLKGKKVYLKYWASWCSICLAGLEDVDTLSKEAKDFKVLTVVTPNAMGEKNSEAFISWFTGVGMKHTQVLLDVDGKYAREFGVRAFPSSIFIDSQGNIAKFVPGFLENKEINNIMEKIK